MARRNEDEYYLRSTEAQPGCISREGDRLSHSRALSSMVVAQARRDAHVVAMAPSGAMRR
jgi:hypothetical protein